MVTCKKCLDTGKVLKGRTLIKCPCKATKKEERDTVLYETAVRRFGVETSKFKKDNSARRNSRYRSDLKIALDDVKKALHNLRRVFDAGKKLIYRSPYDKS